MKIGILVQEGLTDYSDTPKSTQGAHLYTSYEATYALKWSGVEIGIGKIGKIGIFKFSS